MKIEVVCRDEDWDVVGEAAYICLDNPNCKYEVRVDHPRIGMETVHIDAPEPYVYIFINYIHQRGVSVEMFGGAIDLDKGVEKNRHRTDVIKAISLGIAAIAFVLCALYLVMLNTQYANAEPVETGYNMEFEEVDNTTRVEGAVNPYIREVFDYAMQTVDQELMDAVSADQRVDETEYVDAEYYYGDPEYSGNEDPSTRGVMPADTIDNLRWQGIPYDDNYTYTYYSQKVLPGGGLDIPGRHVDPDGVIRDADGYICVSSDDHAKYSVIETAYGTAKVYDAGSGSGNIDIYTNWD